MGQIIDIHAPKRHFGKAQIQFIGHSTTIITTRAGKRIVVDPFFEQNPLCPAALKDPGRIDYIVLTHGHFDHTADAAPLAKKYGATIFANWELGHLLLKEGVPAEQVQMMNKGGGMEIPDGGGCWIYLTQAFHSSSFVTSDGVTHYAGEACGVVLQLENGDAIYHAGDTALFSDMSLIAEQFAPKIALLPVGDRFTMDAEDAAEAARMINPEIAIPLHYGTFPGLVASTPDEFVEQLKTSEIKVLPLEPGGTYEF